MRGHGNTKRISKIFVNFVGKKKLEIFIHSEV